MLARIRELENSNIRHAIVLRKYRDAKCFCCGSGDLTAAPYPSMQDPDFAKLDVLGCARCGISWVPEFPFDLGVHYSKRFKREYGMEAVPDPKQYFRSLENGSRSKPRDRAKRQAWYLDQLAPAARVVLDYGAGPGAFLHALSRTNGSVYAADRDPNSARYLQALGAKLLSEDELGSLSGRVDFLLSSNFLQYRSSIEFAQQLEFFRKLLSSDGVVCIEVPRRTLTRHHVTCKHAPYAVFFSPESLKRLLVKAGFHSVAVGIASADSKRERVLTMPVYTPRKDVDDDSKGPIVAVASLRENDRRLKQFRFVPSRSAAPKRAAAEVLHESRAVRGVSLSDRGNLDRLGFFVISRYFREEALDEMLGFVRQRQGLVDSYTVSDALCRMPELADTKLFAQMVGLARETCGTCAFLQCADLIVNKKAPNWHRDGVDRTTGVGPEWKKSAVPYRVVKVIAYLDASNHGLGVVPGSHRAGDAPTGPGIDLTLSSADTVVPEELLGKNVGLVLKRGDAIVFDVRLFHKGIAFDGDDRIDVGSNKVVPGKATLNVCFGSDNLHSERFFAYYRYLRRDVDYRTLDASVVSRLKRAGVDTVYNRNLFVDRPEEAKGAFLTPTAIKNLTNEGVKLAISGGKRIVSVTFAPSP